MGTGLFVGSPASKLLILKSAAWRSDIDIVVTYGSFSLWLGKTFTYSMFLTYLVDKSQDISWISVLDFQLNSRLRPWHQSHCGSLPWKWVQLEWVGGRPLLSPPQASCSPASSSRRKSFSSAPWYFFPPCWSEQPLRKQSLDLAGQQVFHCALIDLVKWCLWLNVFNILKREYLIGVTFHMLLVTPHQSSLCIGIPTCAYR